MYRIIYTSELECFKDNKIANINKAYCDIETIGGRITFYRLENNMTQQELADKSRLDRNTIVDYEKNHLQHKLKNIDKIADALKIKPYFIYDDYLKFVSGDFPTKIRNIRFDMKLTRKEFAYFLDISKSLITDWEIGRTIPSRKTYYEIKDKIKIKIG